MDTLKKIPCTVAVLTRNSGHTLSRALESVKDFAEIIICDGASTDDTLKIAQQYGARVLSQGLRFLNDEGRIIDFAGVRNQTLEAATEPWFFFLDSDEYVGQELVEEIVGIISSGTPAAYYVPRFYTLNDEIICCASTYPNQQMRFFNRTVTKTFIKHIHERIDLKDEVVPLRLMHPMYVPLPSEVSQLVRRWKHYLDLEDAYRAPMSVRSWLSFALHQTLIAVLYVLRYLKGLVMCRGKRLPLRLELPRLWYQYEVVRRAARTIHRF